MKLENMVSPVRLYVTKESGKSGETLFVTGSSNIVQHFSPLTSVMNEGVYVETDKITGFNVVTDEVLVKNGVHTREVISPRSTVQVYGINGGRPVNNNKYKVTEALECPEIEFDKSTRLWKAKQFDAGGKNYTPFEKSSELRELVDKYLRVQDSLVERDPMNPIVQGQIKSAILGEAIQEYASAFQNGLRAELTTGPDSPETKKASEQFAEKKAFFVSEGYQNACEILGLDTSEVLRYVGQKLGSWRQGKLVPIPPK